MNLAGPPLGNQPSRAPTELEATERSLLVFSAWMGVFFAVLGVGWGVAIQSGIILFDGIYSSFSILLTLLSIVALRALGKPDDVRYPFGRAVIEPLIVSMRSVAIISLCAYAALTAVLDIVRGAVSAPATSLGILYSVIAVVACAASWLYLKIRGRDLPDLVQAELEQWLVDTVFSVIVLLSFVAGYGLAQTRFAAFVPYIDPVMVVLVSLVLVWVPLQRLLASVREILMMAPSTPLRMELQAEVDSIARAHGFDRAVVRSAKIGRQLALDITLIAAADMNPVDLAELDQIRSEISQQLATFGYELYLNVLFTKNSYWA